MKKTQKYQRKKSFSIIGHFFFFGGCPKFPFFWQLGKKARTQKHYKIGVSENIKNSSESRNGHFGQKKPNPEIPVIIFFAFSFSFNNNKTHK